MGDALQNRQIQHLPTSASSLYWAQTSHNSILYFRILLLHCKKCLSSLKSTHITLSYEIFLREINLNRAEPFSKYNSLSLHWGLQSLGYRQISYGELHTKNNTESIQIYMGLVFVLNLSLKSPQIKLNLTPETQANPWNPIVSTKS